MATHEWAGWLGAILGSGLGLAGGVFGTWCSLRAAETPRQRAFLIRCAVLAWSAIAAFLLAMLAAPPSWRPWLWVVYGPALAAGIVGMNRRWVRLRAFERDAVGQ